MESTIARFTGMKRRVSQSDLSTKVQSLIPSVTKINTDIKSHLFYHQNKQQKVKIDDAYNTQFLFHTKVVGDAVRNTHLMLQRRK